MIRRWLVISLFCIGAGSACAAYPSSPPNMITPEGYALATCADMRAYDQLLQTRATVGEPQCAAAIEQITIEIHRRAAAIFAAAELEPSDDALLQWCRANPDSIDGQVLALLVLQLQIVQNSCQGAMAYWQLRYQQWQLPAACQPTVAQVPVVP